MSIHADVVENDADTSCDLEDVSESLRSKAAARTESNPAEESNDALGRQCTRAAYASRCIGAPKRGMEIIARAGLRTFRYPERAVPCDEIHVSTSSSKKSTQLTMAEM